MTKKILTVLTVYTGLLLSSSFSHLGYAQADTSMRSISSSGVEREYMFYLPEGGSGPLALVFNFHGSGGIPQGQEDVSDFIALAEKHRFAVAFPAGEFSNSVSNRSWNANLDEGVDDVQFVRDMIEAIAEEINLDRNRIYVMGFSGGARMSSRLACELSDVLAAAAPVAGIQYPDECSVKQPIPLLSFHGKADQVNQYTVSGNSRPYWRMGVETAVDKWRQANGCSLVNNNTNSSELVTLFTWEDCAGSASIQFYAIEEGGHTWPGSEFLVGNGALGETNMEINASELIWAFFSQHSLEK